ncbi:lysosomal-associated transmembrane protein 5 isoform X2 [Engystomops pustulosus]|uniref:lysosomal-associated transmembrane protein 5 isoform X2 n=1 Tax=Engystomops pustulosus TaxID=76066 RepID=UPI003AFA8AE4
MRPELTKGEAKSKGIKVEFFTKILAIYHVGICIILFIKYSLEMGKEKNCCIELSNFNYIDKMSSYLLLAVLFLISLSLVTGVMMKCGRLVMPFMALQIMDFMLSCLMFFTSDYYIPTKQATFIGSNEAISQVDIQPTVRRYFEMFLRLMINCSSYAEVPTYLNLKPTNYITYFSTSISSEKYIKEIIICSVLHIAVILYKALMIWCIWKVFKSSHYIGKNSSKDKLFLKEISKTALPSYTEATKLESKDLPPPYSVV